MKCLSLYCGAGGIDEGLRLAGIKTTLAIDIWNDACETMKINHVYTEVICGKVSDIKSSLGNFDLVVGGPPCPEFSRAKTNRTFNACEVNNFWDIVEQVKAKYHIMENVQDVIKVIPNKKNYLVNCADYGVPQTRIRRIFTNLPLPKPTHSEFPCNTLFEEPMKKWVSVKEALGLNTGILEDRTMKHKGDDFRTHSIDKPIHTLITDSRDFFISNSGHSTQNRESITRSVDQPADTIVCGSQMIITDYEIKSIKKIRNRIILDKHPPSELDKTAVTITTKDRGWNGDSILSDGNYARKLTNEELAILQGFRKDFKFYGGKTSVRKQIGNAVPPPLILAFGKLI